MKVEEAYEDNFISEVTKLYYRYCQKNNKEFGKVIQKQFVESLVGCKVKVKNSTGVYNGDRWNRIDIVEFV